MWTPTFEWSQWILRKSFSLLIQNSGPVWAVLFLYFLFPLGVFNLFLLNTLYRCTQGACARPRRTRAPERSARARDRCLQQARAHSSWPHWDDHRSLPRQKGELVFVYTTVLWTDLIMDLAWPILNGLCGLTSHNTNDYCTLMYFIWSLTWDARLSVASAVFTSELFQWANSHPSP